MAGKTVIKNIFDVACKTLRGQTVELSQYKGKVVLVENVASL
jgi:glutathione peroxidase-family protein